MNWKPAAYELHGKLDLTNVADLLVFLESSGKNGALGLSRGLGGKKARIYFMAGQIAHAASGDLTGISALADVLEWNSGDFNFAPGVDPPRVTLEMPLQFALMEAARIRDETHRKKDERRLHSMTQHAQPAENEMDAGMFGDKPVFDFELAGETMTADDEDATGQGAITPESERREGMPFNMERGSTEVLEDLLKVPGVDAVVVVGRDGFVIESTGSSTRMNIDALGAALAHAINGIEEMGGELKIDRFSDLFVEYGRAVLLCRPVGEAVAVLVTPDASKLGIIRHKARKQLEELGELF